jgi:hypothetical protein
VGSQARPTTAVPASPLRFEDVAASAGLDFKLGHAGRSPLNVLETAGGGAAFLDFDSDGLLDALLVGPHRLGLFRNTGGGRFRDVTAASGLDPARYWMGCSTGDYDGDGRVDLLLTGYRCTTLYRNTGGRFVDVTIPSGVKVPGWALSGAFADYDRDGRLDLYVTRYLRFDEKTPQLCRLGSLQTACGPEVYEPQHGMLFHNLGGGKFEDVTARAGLSTAHGKSWAALFSDFNDDGYPDLYVANDMTPCDFYLSERGRFVSSGAGGSVAYDGNGHLMGAMGVDSGDYNNDGRLDLLVTTYFAQPTSLYRNDGEAFFTEVGTPAGIGAASQQYVGFGTGLVDFDNDGWLDMFLANGHVRDNVKQHDAGQDYAQPLQLFRNRNGQFQEVSREAGAPFGQPLVGRGAAFGDYDADGKVDVLVCNLEGAPLLLRNVTTSANHWLRVRLRGGGGNRQALGALVRIRYRGGSQVREVRTSGSVLSGSEPVAHFGLGAETVVEQLTIRWPDGRETTHRDVTADQVVELTAPGK